MGEFDAWMCPGCGNNRAFCTCEGDELPVARADDVFPRTVLPPDWWQSRSTLRATRAWAVAGGIPPELLLGHVLAATALGIPVGVHLPPIIGAPTPINFGVVLVSPSGVGKSLSRALAAMRSPSTWSTTSRRTACGRWVPDGGRRLVAGQGQGRARIPAAPRRAGADLRR